MGLRRWSRHLLISLAALASGAALAEDIPSAIGRISYGDAMEPGAAICTGVLVAPDLVLTAGHCVRGSSADPGRIRFEAGWHSGQPMGRGNAVRVVLPEGDGGSADVALVVLSAPFPPDAVLPLRLASLSLGPFRVHAFQRDAPERPAPVQICRPLTIRSGLLGLDCPAVSGNSGAPLLRREGGEWVVVAVMVAASSAGPVRSWATLPPEGFVPPVAP